jgi:membrane protease YdiL (CAAX protease family)
MEFAIVCLVLTWIPWFTMGALGANLDEGPGSLIFGLAASGPSFAALVMWLRHRETRTSVRFRRSPGWSVAAVAAGAIGSVGTAVILNSGDLAVIPHHAAATIAGVGGPLVAFAYTFLAGPVSEEFGWRGYVQPRLRQSLGTLATTAVLGTAWALWHLPLFFLSGTGQHDLGLFNQQGLVFFMEFYPLTFLMLFVTEHLRGGVPAAILTHAASNLADELMPPLDNGGLWLRLVVLTVAATAAGVWWRRANRRTALVPVRPPVARAVERCA